MGGSGFYVAVYDVTDNRERRRVGKVLEGFGFRVQYSVFECRMTRAGLAALRRRLEALALETGCVFVYRSHDTAKRFAVGQCPESGPDDGYAYIVA